MVLEKGGTVKVHGELMNTNDILSFERFLMAIQICRSGAFQLPLNVY